MKTSSTPAKRQLKVSEVKTATASTCPDNVSPKPESIDMWETTIRERSEDLVRAWATEQGVNLGFAWEPLVRRVECALRTVEREALERVQKDVAGVLGKLYLDATAPDFRCAYRMAAERLGVALGMSGDTLPTPPVDNGSGEKR